MHRKSLREATAFPRCSSNIKFVDLGKCPRCGQDWSPGDELCPHCGFVPIGAGLKAQAKSAEIQADPARQRAIELDLGFQREPGSRPGLILTAILLILMSIAYDQKVWTNDWEPIRILAGAPPSPNIVGDWGITASEQLDREGIDAKVQGLTGDFVFGQNGAARVHLYRGFDEMEATGQFSQRGTTVILYHLEGTNGGTSLPESVTLNIVWRNGSQMQMDIQGQERVSLQRQAE